MKRSIAILFFLILVTATGFSQCGLTPFTLLAPSAAEITATSVQLNWGSATGGTCAFPPATGKSVSYFVEYKLASTAIWQTWSDTPCTIRTENVGGLTAGELYHFRVIADAICNFGDNDQALPSNQISVVLEPPAPVSQSASLITATSFTANWNTALGASEYLLDVSTDGFSSFVTGYNGKIVTGTSDVVTLLSPNTTYSYRVRSANGSGQSTYSGTKSATTLEAEPTTQSSNISFTNPGETSLTVSWVNGNGNEHLVVVNQGSVVSFIPQDGSGYTGNSNFLTAADQGSGNKIVYRGNSNSVIVTGMAIGTVYHFRVYDLNGSAQGTNYLTTTATGNPNSRTTLVTAPTSQATALVFSNITTTSLDGSFTTAGNPTGYIVLRRAGASPTGVPVDGITYSENDVIGNATVVSVGVGTSFTSTGLAANTIYHFNVIAYNGSGDAINYLTTLPLQGSHSTMASEPTEQATNLTFSNVTISSLDGSFTAAAGNPSGYIVLRRQGNPPTGVPVDGTTYSEGSTIEDGTVVSVGASTSFTDANLTINTVYHYRVFSYNGSGLLINYLTSAPLTGSTITLPSVPNVSDPFTELEHNSFKFQWQSVPNATQYELEVSTNDIFTNLLTGYNPKTISGLTESYVEGEGVSASTVYYLRVRARNASGVSDNSGTTSIRTKNTDGTSKVLEIKSVIVPDPPVYEANNQMLSVSINDGGIGLVNGFIYHRSNSSAAYTQLPLIENGNTYSININGEWVDELGMQFYLEVRDQYGQSALYKSPDDPYTLVKKYLNVKMDRVNRFGKSVENYHIISMPYDLPGDPTIETIFEPIMRKYDNSKWRMGKYDKDGDIEYNNGLGKQAMEQGQGYWFISRYEKELTFNGVTAYKNTSLNPFKLKLKKGWNQIGNPFPFNIRWADVLRDNGNPQGVGSYREYNHEIQNIEEMDGIMEVFSGGFVLADNDIELTFKTTLEKQPGTGGRMRGEPEDTDNNSKNWVIPITLVQGELINSLPGIGMRQNAVEGKDRYDLVASPRFVRYAEFNSRRKGYEYALARDIVAVCDAYTWHYSLEHNSEEPVTLRWNNAKVTALDGQLVLHDVTNHTLINMSTANEYTLSSKAASFKIYYNTSVFFEDNTLSLGIPYPNPFQSQIKIPFDYSVDANYSADIVLTIFDAQGRKISEVRRQFSDDTGLKQLEWDGLTETGLSVQPGMYLYKLKVSGTNGSVFFHGKLIKQ